MSGTGAEARAADAIRGAVAADPGLAEDEERFAAEAERVAEASGLGGDDRRGLRDRLVALRGQLVEAGS